MKNLDNVAMSLRRRASLFGAAAMAGGALHVIKGVVLAAGGPDLSLVPPMSFLFSVGLIGLYIRLERNDRSPLAAIGLVFAVVAIASSAIGLVYLVAGVAPEDPGSPVLAQIAYAGLTLGILIGLLLLALAIFRANVISSRWRYVPLGVGVIWFPLEALTAVLPDGWGLIAAGMTWVALGYTIWPAPLWRGARPLPSSIPAQ